MSSSNAIGNILSMDWISIQGFFLPDGDLMFSSLIKSGWKGHLEVWI